jgi:hypothetical protein
MPSSATAIEQMNGTTFARTGKSKPSAVTSGTDQGRRSCAARIAASNTRTRTRPVVIPTYCTPSSFTTFCSVEDGSDVLVVVGAGEGSEVCSVVEDGSGEGSAVSVAVGSGDGEGEVTAGFTTVTKFPLEVPDDVPGKSSNKTEGKERGDDERIHYRPQMIEKETSAPSETISEPTTATATAGAGEARVSVSDDIS